MGETFGRSGLFGRSVVAVCAALLLVACGGDGETDADSVVADSSAPAASAAPAPADSADDPVLAVAGDGVRVFDGASESGRPLPFGMPMEAVLATVEGLRGKAERSTNAECGAGSIEFANWKDGLGLLFQEGRFVGWSLDGRSGGEVKTGGGIAPGSTRRELEAAHQIKVDETSLGTEFMAGDIGGVLDGAGPDARILTMWAGVNCVFR